MDEIGPLLGEQAGEQAAEVGRERGGVAPVALVAGEVLGQGPPLFRREAERGEQAVGTEQRDPPALVEIEIARRQVEGALAVRAEEPGEGRRAGWILVQVVIARGPIGGRGLDRPLLQPAVAERGLCRGAQIVTVRSSQRRGPWSRKERCQAWERSRV